MSETKVLSEFENVSRTLLNPYIEEWKNHGKGVLGFNCSFFPEEIVQAAGLLPFRIRGTGCTETHRADSYLARANCSFARACLEHLLRGNYDFLDGAVFVYSCDHMCTAHNSWKAQGKLPLIESIISVPHTVTKYGWKFYREEIVNIKKRIEEHFEVEITNDRLKEAIVAGNETQYLKKRLYELRGKSDPSITGSQCLSVLIADSSMPKAEYNRLLKALIEELENKEGVAGYKYRLMVSGSAIDDPALLNIIEDSGGLVVADTLCYGAGHSFREPIAEEGDPLDAITDGYYKQILCPRMFDAYPQRLDFALDAAKQADVQGIVLQSIRNCDIHGIDNVMFEKDFEKNGIPVLVLEREYDVLADAGRIRTRVQAFLERIGRK
ncbi:MAG: 2-hydroxyacyl-CoA dehydratase [Proteobacteria bacterium]|nr:2-hydroxyacyl-CoA dehydratase [Pseudomonadota bacterium]